MKNTELDTEQDRDLRQVESKSAEQLNAEASLNMAIPDESSGQGAEQQTAQPENNNGTAQTALAGLLGLIPIGLNIGGLPRTAAVWTGETINALSAAFIPVFRKHAWGQKIINFLETGGGVEELALAAVIAPLALASYSEYTQETANYEAARREAEKEVKAASDESKNQ